MSRGASTTGGCAALLLLLSLSTCAPPRSTPPEIHALNPPRGPARGGQPVRVTGVGFDSSSRVLMGGRAARVTAQQGEELSVLTPVGIAGPVTVEVTAGDERAVLDGGYTYERIPFRLYDAAELRLEAGPLEAGLGAVADYQGDGDEDVFQAARREGLSVLVNEGERVTQRFLGPAAPDGGSPRDVFSVAAADFDGDGVVDVFLGTSGKTPSALLFGRPDGRFEEVEGTLPLLLGSEQRPVVLDSDRDGDLDLLVTASALADADAPSAVLLTNDGHGRFTDASSKLAGPKLAPRALSAGDFDGDGDVDLFFSMGSESCRLFLGDGQGAFQLAAPDALPLDSQPHAGEAAVGDLDRNGTLDLYVPTERQDQVWLNDGTAHFVNLTEVHVSPEVQAGDAARFVDLDLDGHLDVVVVERPGRLRFLRNDGQGRLFDYSPDVAGNDAAARTMDALVVDLEGDGAPEVFAGRAGVARPALFVTTLDGSDSDADGWVDSLDACPASPAAAQAHRAPFGCASSAACQQKLGCQLQVWGESAYLSCGAKVTYEAGQAFCTAQGGALARIDDEKENAALAKGLLEASWIALDDLATEGQWAANGAPLSWTSWGAAQPDNAGAGEDCGSLRPDGTWNDLPCGSAARSLCEAPRFPAASARCPVAGLDGGGP